jgi:hypothetical protein
VFGEVHLFKPYLKDLKMDPNYRISNGIAGECLLELLYPNDSIIGDYVCSVANIGGNDSLTFTIEKLLGEFFSQ